MRGHIPAPAVGSRSLGRLPATNRLNLVIGLPLRNEEALTNLLEQLYNPTSPQFRHYLTPEQFSDQFGPSKADYAAVKAWAQSQSLLVTATHPNRTLLDVSGSVEAVERAFHVNLRAYQHPSEARSFYAPDVEPSVDLATPLLRIGGLENLNVPRPLWHRSLRDPRGRARPLAGSGPGGSFTGYDFRAAYVPGVSLMGSNQAVALVEFDGYYPSDVATYETGNGLPDVPLQTVLLGGFDGSPGDANDEVSLDIEMAVSMAPGLAQVIVYEATWSSALDMLNRIATDNAAKQISASWTLSFDAATDQVFRQYAAQGQSFFQASGDWGASSWIAEDPYITTVGGTELSTSGPGGAWVSESVWSLGYNYGQSSYIGSGGGISSTYSIPSWQRGLNTVANRGSAVRRNVPDVAMAADRICFVFYNGYWGIGWGTSAAAPLWAGFAALANQLAEDHGQPPIGFINPAIYALGKGASYRPLFHDVTTGSTSNAVDHTGFPAMPGYDLCTGWGTPAGSNLLEALALPQLLQIAPGTNVIVSGPPTGPFSQMAASYALTNGGSVPLDWALGSTASWLDASATNGTLMPAAPGATISLNLNSEAATLPLGSYEANLWFTNLNDGSVQGRLFTLAVLSTPLILGGPANQTVPDGSTATFTVVVAQNALLSYAWNLNGTGLSDKSRISGATTASLVISNVSSTDAGTYTVTVSNVAGMQQAAAMLVTTGSPPVIVAAPASQTVLPASTAIFVVAAVGTQPLRYEWQMDGTNLTSSGNTSVLTLRNVSAANAGAYSVVVSNSAGSVTNGGFTLALIPATQPEVSLSTLYSFSSGNNGANPNGLVLATNGSFYGTADSGGASGNGTVFRITTNGVLTTLHSFSGGNDGGTPKAALIQGTDGLLYGTTQYGGPYYGGTVFRVSVGGGFSTLHSFTYGADGGYVFAGLMQAADGNFYGATWGGGDNGNGTIFKITRTGSFSTLHSFSGADGANPGAPPIQAADGRLFGVTQNGGAHRLDGTVYALTTNRTFEPLLQFDRTNSAGPRGALVQSKDGNLYGTTRFGGGGDVGTVFRILPSGAMTTLHSFDGAADGAFPVAALVEDEAGYLYGTTLYGGPYDGGTVFRINPNGLLTTLVQFDGYNGANPAGALVQAAPGTFYGTTLNGGANGAGTVFRLTVPALRLGIAPADNGLVLSWPAWAADLVLQQNANVAATGWSPVTAPRVITNGQLQVVLTPGPGTSTFYRLSH